MRINELTGPHKIKQSPLGMAAKAIADTPPKPYQRTRLWNLFSKELQDLGFEDLGRGSYGAVFEKPGYPWVFKVFDDDIGYIAYLKYAMEHQNNPAVPKIKGKPIRINKTTYAIRTEKLYPTTGNSTVLGDELLHIPSVRNLEQYVGFADYIEGRWPDIAAVLKDLPHIPGGPFHIDLHQENIMQRADGTPVITDPLIEQ